MSTTTEIEPMTGTREVIQTKMDEAHVITKRYVYWSMGLSLIPIPFLDMAAVGGVQLKMLCDLSKLYGVKFSENRASAIIASLIGSVGTGSASVGLASLVKLVPIVGPLAGFAVSPAVAGASTWAIGKVFINHFETGGTFLDFDPEKTRQYYAEHYREGQKVAADLKRSGRPA